MQDTVWNEGYYILPGEDKIHNSGLILSKHNILVPN